MDDRWIKQGSMREVHNVNFHLFYYYSDPGGRGSCKIYIYRRSETWSYTKIYLINTSHTSTFSSFQQYLEVKPPPNADRNTAPSVSLTQFSSQSVLEKHRNKHAFGWTGIISSSSINQHLTLHQLRSQEHSQCYALNSRSLLEMQWDGWVTELRTTIWKSSRIKD